MATSIGKRIFGTVILLGCLGVLGWGAWFFYLRDLIHADDDVASEDEPDELVMDVDGGAHRVHHPAGKHKGKSKGGGHKSPTAATRRTPSNSGQAAVAAIPEIPRARCSPGCLDGLGEHRTSALRRA